MILFWRNRDKIFFITRSFPNTATNQEKTPSDRFPKNMHSFSKRHDLLRFWVSDFWVTRMKTRFIHDNFTRKACFKFWHSNGGHLCVASQSAIVTSWAYYNNRAYDSWNTILVLNEKLFRKISRKKLDCYKKPSDEVSPWGPKLEIFLLGKWPLFGDSPAPLFWHMLSSLNRGSIGRF